MIRSGPHPLPIHLGIAMAQHEEIAARLPPLSHRLSTDELTEMMRGIQMYQSFPDKAEKGKLRKVWSHGATRLLRVAGRKKNKHSDGHPLILVPSLINKADILDLSEQRSLLQWFEGRGIDCYLLDWGCFVNKEEQNIDLNSLIDTKLIKAIQYVSKTHEKSVDCLGYCMGGTLLALAQMRVTDVVRRCILLAAPWDFHAPEMRLSDHVRSWSPAIMPQVRERGVLPSRWLQSLFATLDTEGSARKFIRFAKMDQNSSEARLFVAVEDWLNAGDDLPAELVTECLRHWFSENEPYRDPKNKRFFSQKQGPEFLIVASSRDRLVPLQSATAIKYQDHKTKFQILDPKCGHIGFIAGKNSIENVWQPMYDWLRRDSEQAQYTLDLQSF